MTQLIDKVAADYARETLTQPDYPTYNDEYEIMRAFEAGAEWAYSNVLKSADGDDLPEIDREVIALVEENEHYKPVFAHRPPEYWDGKNVLTGKVTRYTPKTYDKGNWNQPDVKWWLDIEVPKTKMEEDV